MFSSAANRETALIRNIERLIFPFFSVELAMCSRFYFLRKINA